MRVRFFVAGLLVPLALLAFFVLGILKSSPNLLGYTVNLMFALVGWHYVKQGYGALMLCAVRRKQFFSKLDKKLLLANAFAAWVYGWSRGNVYSSQSQFWGINYSTFTLPGWTAQISIWALGLTSLLVLAVFLRKAWSSQGKLPWNGIIAYICALYVWTSFVHIFPQGAFLFIPAFHSLQYIIMVWKYEDKKLSLEQKQTKTAAPSEWRLWLQKYWFLVPLGLALCLVFKIVPQGWVNSMEYEQSILFSAALALIAGLFLRRIFIFIVSGILLGMLGFWLVPVWLQSSLSYDQQLFGGALFLFMAWIMINVHHYFMDSVIWRKENDDVGRYLFQ